jgi:hypothetical protein
MSPKQSQYFQDLKNPKWQQKRLEIMKRDEFTCKDCGAKDTELQVHHKVYTKDAKPWEYNNRTLITLCKKCHEERKWLMEEIKKSLESDGRKAMECVLMLTCVISQTHVWNRLAKLSQSEGFTDTIRIMAAISHPATEEA